MKRLSKEEFEARKNAIKFARKVGEKFALEMKIKNGEYIDPKKRNVN